jgi:hypothetical protein
MVFANFPLKFFAKASGMVCSKKIIKDQPSWESRMFFLYQ